MTYDRRAVAEYFDALGDREWDRLETSLRGRIKYAVHERLIAQHVARGMRVLDVGAGPGRFALDIVERGASVTLVDLSRVQLDLAQQRLSARSALDQCGGFYQLDVLDLTSLAEAGYDAVVCFGGAVSYTRSSSSADFPGNRIVPATRPRRCRRQPARGGKEARLVRATKAVPLGAYLPSMQDRLTRISGRTNRTRNTRGSPVGLERLIDSPSMRAQTHFL